MPATHRNTSESCQSCLQKIRAGKTPTSDHEWRFNAPVTNEIAILMVRQESEWHDIVLQQRDSQILRVSETHCAKGPVTP